MSKYGNRRTVVDGEVFDSRAESEHYTVLRLLEQEGEISDLIIHPVYELQPKFKRGGKVIRAIAFEGDFAFTEQGRRVVVDVKGVRTAVFLLKQKLFLFKYPDIELRIVDV